MYVKVFGRCLNLTWVKVFELFCVVWQAKHIKNRVAVITAAPEVWPVHCHWQMTISLWANFQTPTCLLLHVWQRALCSLGEQQPQETSVYAAYSTAAFAGTLGLHTAHCCRFPTKAAPENMSLCWGHASFWLQCAGHVDFFFCTPGTCPLMGFRLVQNMFSLLDIDGEMEPESVQIFWALKAVQPGVHSKMEPQLECWDTLWPLRATQPFWGQTSWSIIPQGLNDVGRGRYWSTALTQAKCYTAHCLFSVINCTEPPWLDISMQRLLGEWLFSPLALTRLVW